MKPFFIILIILMVPSLALAENPTYDITECVSGNVCKEGVIENHIVVFNAKPNVKVKARVWSENEIHGFLWHDGKGRLEGVDKNDVPNHKKELNYDVKVKEGRFWLEINRGAPENEKPIYYSITITE